MANNLNKAEILEFMIEFENFFDSFGEEGQKEDFLKACQSLSIEETQLLDAVLQKTISSERLTEKLEGESLDKGKMACALYFLESKLSKTKDKLLLLLAVDLCNSPEANRQLKEVHPAFWEFELLKNKLLSTQQIQVLWDVLKSDYEGLKKDAWGSPVRCFAKLPCCPKKVLFELLEFNDKVIRQDVAYHKNSTDKIYKFFLTSKRKTERMLMADKKNSSKQVLLFLMKDKLKDIKSVARKNYKYTYPDDYSSIKASEMTKAIKYFTSL